jgi:hypothetical protein
MQVFEYQGEYVASALLDQLRAASIDCAGITCSEDDQGTVTAVQIICDDGTDKASVDTAVAAYTPPSPPPDVANAEDHAAVSAGIVTEKLAAVAITREELPAILQTLLGEASSAIPFFEQYALDPSMTSQQWADFQALDQTTKDRLLYDLVRSTASLMRYLTGDLPTS